MLIHANKLTKRYGDFTAIDGCNLRVEKGEVFGLLGPNGAGKTTLLRILLAFLKPTSGTATIDGRDVLRERVAVHQRLAYLPGDVRLFRHMRGDDLLRFYAGLRAGYSWRTARDLAARLDLNLRQRVSAMSTGMRQKLALAATFAAEVALYILDEPTTNLDPNVRQEVGQLVQEARARGATVLFSSHVLSEVEEICDRVAILKDGSVAFEQVIAELRRKHRIEAELAGTLPELPDRLRPSVSTLEQNNKRLTVEVAGGLQPLLAWLAEVPIHAIHIEPFGLQSVYRQFHPPRPMSTSTDTEAHV